MTATGQPEVATFASGCFWGVEHIFLKQYPPSQNKGILKTSVGYTGGTVPNPSYRDVCNEGTGHAEAVRIEFDPNIVTYQELVGKWPLDRLDDESYSLILQNFSSGHTIRRFLTAKAMTEGPNTAPLSLLILQHSGNKRSPSK